MPAFHFEAHKNGSLAALPGNAMKVLSVYMATCDRFNNSWASTNPRKACALDTGTGLSHNTIREARKWLADHGVIQRIDHDTVKRLYQDTKHKPYSNVWVWNLYGIVSPCDDLECNCHKHISDPVPLLYVPARESSEFDDQPKSRSSKVDDSWNGGRSSKVDDDPILESDPILDHRDKSLYRPTITALIEICDVDPQLQGGLLGKVAKQLNRAGYGPEEVHLFNTIWPRISRNWDEYPPGSKPRPALLPKHIHRIKDINEPRGGQQQQAAADRIIAERMQDNGVF